MAILNKALALSGGVGLLALMVASGAEAGGFTIADGQTETSTQVLSSQGDVGTVQSGGTIDGTLNNLFYGIKGVNDNVTVINAGTVTGSAIDILTVDFGSITNTGMITAGLYGIFTFDHNTVKNSGTIMADYVGISIFDHNTLTNSGSVTGSSIALTAESGNTIINSGSMNGNTNGINVENGNSVNNSGSVVSGNIGIRAVYNNTIINSGTIIGTSDAVLLYSNNTLTLLKGSNIQGLLNLGDASNTLVIGPGLRNTALSYVGGAIVNSTGLPMVDFGGTAYVVDGAVFSVQDDLANDLTRAVTGTVEDRLDAARNAGSGLSMKMGDTFIHATSGLPQADASGFWISGLGSTRHQASNGATAPEYNSSLGGLLIGRDGMMSTHTRAGAFGGYSASGLQTQDGDEDFHASTVLGGLYLGHDMGHSFIDASLTFGHAAFDGNRNHILNNMVAGGMEQATAQYGGWLFSPSVKLGTAITAPGGTVTPSLRLRYTGLMMDGYSETGSAADLTVAGRAVNVFDGRAELAVAPTPVITEYGSWGPTLRVGVEGNLSSDAKINASIAGQALSFRPEGSNVVRGFAGLDLSFKAKSGSLTLATEAGYDSNRSFTGQASASLDFAF